MDAAPLSTDAALAMRRRTLDLGSHSASWTPAAPASALIASPAASMLGRHRCCAAQQRGGKDGHIAYRCATPRAKQHLHCRLQRAGRSSGVRIRSARWRKFMVGIRTRAGCRARALSQRLCARRKPRLAACNTLAKQASRPSNLLRYRDWRALHLHIGSSASLPINVCCISSAAHA